MNDDVLAAAERMRRWNADDPTAYPGDYPEVRTRQDADYVTLAAAYLAANPADDATPVDEAWLREVGFWPRGRDELVSPRDAGNRRPWRLIYDADPLPGCGTWSVSFPGCEAGLGYDLPTRGAVRRLAAALGVPLTEGPGC